MQQQANGLSGKQILLVEDSQAARETLSLLLSEDCHTVVQAHNGAEAFALFLSRKFDVVLTDFQMPFVNGDELATLIKRVAPLQPILMITAYDHKPSEDNPVDAVVNKPFDSVQLREAIIDLLSKARS